MFAIWPLEESLLTPRVDFPDFSRKKLLSIMKQELLTELLCSYFCQIDTFPLERGRKSTRLRKQTKLTGLS